MEEVSDFVHPGMPRGARILAWVTLFIIVGAMVGVIVSFFFRSDGPTGDPGELEEATVELPSDLVVPPLVDVTEQWGLADWRTEGERELRGGATLHDLDGDGDLDLLVAGGQLGIYEKSGDQYRRISPFDVGDAVSVNAGDVDGDGAVDLLVGRSDGATIVWGADWFEADAASFDRTELPIDGIVTGVIPLDLDGAGDIQVLILSYGAAEATADLLVRFEDRRQTEVTRLPNSERRSMVAEIADVDDDGLADIWIARDVGWRSGADSIYSRRGDARGQWFDVAPQLNAALEIDAMGLTVADLDGDGRLDAYLSDLGDNELLIGRPQGFEKRVDVGAARIRSAGAPDIDISSSWASGAVDLNLDGFLDLVVVNGGFVGPGPPNKVVNTLVVDDDPPAILLATGDNTYVDVWPYLELPWAGRSRGLTLGDVDDDGDTDIIIVDHDGGIHAFRNDLAESGERLRLPSGCLVTGAIARSGGPGDGWGAPFQQQSFLGAHAPEVIADHEVVAASGSVCTAE